MPYLSPSTSISWELPVCVVWPAPRSLFLLPWIPFSSLTPGSSLSPYLCCHPRSWHREHHSDVLSFPYQTSGYLDTIQWADFFIFFPRVGLWFRVPVWYGSALEIVKLSIKKSETDLRVRESSGFKEITLNLTFAVSFTEIRNMCKVCIFILKYLLFRNPTCEGVRSGTSWETVSLCNMLRTSIPERGRRINFLFKSH